MCRLAYITTNDIEKALLQNLFTSLEKSMGGDGNGIGGFIDGVPLLEKQIKKEAATFVSDNTWDHGYFFHTRRASVGSITDNNCHPFVWGDTITCHNGHIDGAGVLKLMMLEHMEKYAVDGWTLEKLMDSTDSNIMAYFIWKNGFEIVSLLSCGTVMTMYRDKTLIHAGNDLEAIDVGGSWVFASDFSDEMGMKADQWIIFAKDSEIIVKTSNECTITKGYCVDGKKIYLEKKEKEAKKKKGNKNNEITCEVAQYVKTKNRRQCAIK